MVASVINSAQSSSPARGPEIKRGNLNSSSSETNDKNRDAGKTLASRVGDTAQKITEGVTKTAIAQGGEAAKMGMKMGLEGILYTTFYPINLFVNNLPGGPQAALMLLSPVSGWLSDKLEAHAQKIGFPLPMKPKEIIEKLLTGEYHELSDEVTNMLTSFVEKAMSPEIQKAFASGNPLQIAKATGTSITGSLKGIASDMQNIQGNLLTKPFKWLGSKIPFVNRLPKALQPWAAGIGAFMFGGAIIRTAFKFVNWLILGAGGIALLNFGKKALMGGLGGGASHGGGGGIGALLGGASRGGGLMDMVSMGSKALGALGQMQRK